MCYSVFFCCRICVFGNVAEGGGGDDFMLAVEFCIINAAVAFSNRYRK